MADSLLGLIGVVLLLALITPWSPNGSQLDPPLVLLTFGHDAQLIGSPDSSDSGFKGIAFRSRDSSGAVVGGSSPVGRFAWAEVLPDTESLLLGCLLGCSQFL